MFMSRYDYVCDFKKKFLEENPSVWKNTLKPLYISINGDDTKVSSNPYAFEESEHGLAIFKYTYTVQTQPDDCIVPLFFNQNGDIEDYIELEGWKMSFCKPITSSYRCYNIYCYISNGPLKKSIKIDRYKLDKEFDDIWKLFSVARRCKTQLELDYAYKLYKENLNVLSLKEANIKQAAEIDSLKSLNKSYHLLIESIKELVEKTCKNK